MLGQAIVESQMREGLRDFLQGAAARAEGEPLELSVRDLLAHWNAKRRGYWVVEEIQGDLARAGLSTDPPFGEAWIDEVVKLVPAQRNAQDLSAPSDPADQAKPSDRALPDVSLRVGSLPSANLGVSTVSPQDTLAHAQALMMRHDYSQLAVMSGKRDLRGAISWDSVAQARIRNPEADLKEATVPAEIVRSEDDLLTQIPRVVGAGFVFVQASDRQISGIVTTSDLSNQFAILAKPFFVLAEIERRLRRVIDQTFTRDELVASADPGSSREIRSAEDLSMGEYVRLLEAPHLWSRLGWALERKVFIDALQQVRLARNEVMHFSPDPLDDDQLRALDNFVKWLRRLVP